jgi:hypothetical protein
MPEEMAVANVPRGKLLDETSFREPEHGSIGYEQSKVGTIEIFGRNDEAIAERYRHLCAGVQNYGWQPGAIDLRKSSLIVKFAASEGHFGHHAIRQHRIDRQVAIIGN